MKLENLRKEQEKTDQKILKLLSKRQETSIKIGDLKAKNGTKIENKELEAKKIKKLQEKNLLPAKFIEEIWTIIFRESKRAQKETRN